MINTTTKKFLDWYEKTARPLPWRQTHDPYKIWVSEIFLQQTQASRVIDYYTRMIEKFPTVESLSQASWDDFFPYFQGLGFYSRGKNMLKTAQYVVEHWDGKFSDNVDQLQKLPGVGKYTASAICSFAYGQNLGAFDTNLYRVMGRFFGVAEKNIDTKKPIPKNLKEIEKRSDFFYSSGKGDLLNHAFMDLGSSLCTSKNADCQQCPLSSECDFFLTGKKIIAPKKKQKKITAQEFSVMLLRHEKKYLLLEKIINGEIFLGFPIFFNQEKKDQRHFLQAKALEKWGITLSIRPPFYEKILDDTIFETIENKNTALPLRLKFSRCQIQQGSFIESPSGKFFSLDEIVEIQNLEPILEGEILERIMKMGI